MLGAENNGLMGNCCYSFDHEVAVDGIISMRLLAIIWVWERFDLATEFLNSGSKKDFAENFNLL